MEGSWGKGKGRKREGEILRVRRKNKKGEGSEGKGCQEREMTAGEVLEGGRERKS